MSEMRPPAWDGVKIPDPPPLRPEKRRVSRWPRGKYNGQRIVGVEVKVRIDLSWWRLGLPNRDGLPLAIGPLRVWFSAFYR